MFVKKMVGHEIQFQFEEMLQKSIESLLLHNGIGGVHRHLKVKLNP